MGLYKITDNIDQQFASDVNQIVDGLKGNADVGEIKAFSQISAPGALTAAVSANVGNLNGAYQYVVAFLTGYWHGQLGTGTLITQGTTGYGTASVTVNPSGQQVSLSAIPTGPAGTVARVIGRTKAGGNTFYQLTQINDNTTVNWTDNTPDTGLGAALDQNNTTGSKFVGDGSGLTNINVRAFDLKSATYDAANDRIACVFGPGVAEFFNGDTSVLVKITNDTTYYIDAPAINTSYQLYVQKDGTFAQDITASGEAIYLWEVTTGDAVDDITTTDNRVEISAVGNKLASHLLDNAYQVAGGTATALTLTISGTLVDGYPMTFIASANNSGAATTINTKNLYKPNTTDAPTLITGKAYTVWYDESGDCFFIKASAEGTAVAADVLAGKTFSNDNDTGIDGTLALSGDATANDVVTGKTFYSTDAKTKLTGINTNKKWASGGWVNVSVGQHYTVSGLDFLPGFVYVWTDYSIGYIAVYDGIMGAGYKAANTNFTITAIADGTFTVYNQFGSQIRFMWFATE